MNHARVDISSSAISCGVVQLSRISDEIEEALFAIATRFYHAAHGQPPAFAIYSNRDDIETNAHRLGEIIHKHDLGYVMKTDRAINPNTGAVIAVFVWQIKHEVFKEWYKTQKIAKIKGQYPKKA